MGGLLLGALVVSACGGAGAQAPDVPEGAVLVEMLDNRFAPVDLEIEVGQTVAFVGAGRNPHNAVAADRSWTTADSFGSLRQLDGDVATVTFTVPGTYQFFCSLHGSAEGKGMAGTLTVVGGG